MQTRVLLTTSKYIIVKIFKQYLKLDAINKEIITTFREENECFKNIYYIQGNFRLFYDAYISWQDKLFDEDK